MNAEYQILSFGLRVLHGAWSQIAPTLARVAETDDDVNALYAQIDSGISDLDRLVRARLRDSRK